MKTALFTIATLAAASPALAHTDAHFHSHGAELFLGLSAIALVVAWAGFSRK